MPLHPSTASATALRDIRAVLHSATTLYNPPLCPLTSGQAVKHLADGSLHLVAGHGSLHVDLLSQVRMGV